MTSTSDLRARLVELKQRFDLTFSEPPPKAAVDFEDLLAIALGSERFMLRLREVEGLYLDRAIAPVPSSVAELLGVADFRGELVAVYDLAAMLGYPRTERPRYLVRVAQRPVGFAFERFEGHVRLTKERVSLQPTTRERPPSSIPPPADATAYAQTIIDLPALVGRLEQQTRSAAGEA